MRCALVAVILLGLCLVEIWGKISDDLFIIIENTEVNSCRGTPNQVSISKRDISIEKTNGDPVSYVKAPGTYRIHFRKIILEKNFPYLSGELSALLQIPLTEGRILRYDAPYSIIPEQTNFGEKCDEDSGVVKRPESSGNTKSFCRYCNMYGVKNKVEGRLNKEHRYLPSVNQFSRQGGDFNQIADRTYEITKYIDLPSKTKLERDITGVEANDQETSKRLRKGEGRFQVQLNLINTNQEPVSFERSAAVSANSNCTCCTQTSQNTPQCAVARYTCRLPQVKDNCRNQYAENCLHMPQIVGCYSVVFHYRITENLSEIKNFLERNRRREPNSPATRASRNQEGSADSEKRRCVNGITNENRRQWCRSAPGWSAGIRAQCCRYCKGVC